MLDGIYVMRSKHLGLTLCCLFLAATAVADDVVEIPIWDCSSTTARFPMSNERFEWFVITPTSGESIPNELA